MLRYLLYISLIASVKCQVDLSAYFGHCQRNNLTQFNNCVKNGLNALRDQFKIGLPDYGVDPLDPFYITEVPQKRNNALFSYKLILRNVTEAGWSLAEITQFRTDFKNNNIQFVHSFPDKKLNGWYEIEGNFFGTRVKNSGSWNLGLYDYVQTMTVTRKPVKDSKGNYTPNPPLKVKVNADSCRKLELHIGHLAGGRTIVENMLDRIINTAWQPGFVLLRPLINDLVSTAFTEIFNKDFQNFPFERLFPN